MAVVETVFKVLENVIARQADGLTFSQIAALSNLPKSTCHRVLNILVEAGYLFFNAQSKLYFATLKISALGAKVVEATDQHRLIRPIMEEMGAQSGVSCQAGIMNGFKGVAIDRVLPHKDSINFFCGLGQEFPLHCTGIGKVLLAHCSESLLNAVIAAGLPMYTDYTITDEKALRRELELVRKQGYARDGQELSMGVVCAAAPIFNYKGEVFMAISLSYPPYREAADPAFAEQMRAMVIHYSQMVSRAMGFKAGETV